MKKEDIKKYLFILIPMIITILIGLFLSSGIIGRNLETQIEILLLSFFPFILYLILLFLFIKNKDNLTKTIVLKWIFRFITIGLLFYYLFALIVIGFEEAESPVTNPKYYNQYINSTGLKKLFPDKIPSNVENVKFYYAPGMLQAGTRYTLYYVDKNMTLSMFDKKYKDKAEWIGHIKEYNEKEGLLAAAFSSTPANYNNEDDYIIYLVDSDCDKSGYCNHGYFLLVAYNEKTHEVIYASESW